MAEIFLSYAKADLQSALELVDELRERGYSIWMDRSSLRGAQNWTAEIVEAIDACSTMLVLISPSATVSHNVAKEIHLASEKRKNILPVVIEKVKLPASLEYSLAGLQRVYFHDRPAILHALEALHGIATTGDLPPEASAPTKDSSIRVAVLPFDDLSSERDNQWFADGMMDELISTLGGIERVKVPPRSDVLHYRHHQKKSREIAMELGVRYLIEGGVRKAHDKIRINTSLVDTLRSEQLWTGKFDGTFENVFAFQESVSKSVAEALSLHLEPKEIAEIEAHPTYNVKAYELYLKGRHEQYYVTKESYLRALDLYEQAAALDPKFERALIGIASVCCAYYREYSKNPKWLARAQATLAKVEAIAGETSRTLYIRGMIEWMKGESDRAISMLTQSATLDPKNYNAFDVLGNIQLENKNYPAAADAFQKVVDIVENTLTYFNLLISLNWANEIGRRTQIAVKALPIFDRYLLREPLNNGAALSRAYVLLWAGRKEEATEAADRLLERNDLSGQTLYNLGLFYGQTGKPELFISLFRKAIANGYRELEQTRGVPFERHESVYEEEYKAILRELEELIEQEKRGSE